MQEKLSMKIILVTLLGYWLNWKWYFVLVKLFSEYVIVYIVTHCAYAQVSSHIFLVCFFFCEFFCHVELGYQLLFNISYARPWFISYKGIYIV